MRPHGVFDGGGQPADDRVAHIFRAEIRILLGSRRRLGDNRVFETGRFEGLLPAFDAANHVRHPLGGRRGIDVIHDRLHGFGKRGGRIFLLQAPARDINTPGCAVLVPAIIQLPHGEEAYPLIEQARRHGMLWQFHHTVMQHDGGAAGVHATCRERVFRAHGRRA